ncbi:MAG: hypothetical protein KDD70_05055 [Bdellovibrionales bacterium]|nr:hypothetical protein [Bdellovibrionales bacterium]
MFNLDDDLVNSLREPTQAGQQLEGKSFGDSCRSASSLGDLLPNGKCWKDCTEQEKTAIQERVIDFVLGEIQSARRDDSFRFRLTKDIAADIGVINKRVSEWLRICIPEDDYEFRKSQIRDQILSETRERTSERKAIPTDAKKKQLAAFLRREIEEGAESYAPLSGIELRKKFDLGKHHVTSVIQETLTEEEWKRRQGRLNPSVIESERKAELLIVEVRSELERAKRGELAALTSNRELAKRFGLGEVQAGRHIREVLTEGELLERDILAQHTRHGVNLKSLHQLKGFLPEELAEFRAGNRPRLLQINELQEMFELGKRSVLACMDEVLSEAERAFRRREVQRLQKVDIEKREAFRAHIKHEIKDFEGGIRESISTLDELSEQFGIPNFQVKKYIDQDLSGEEEQIRQRAIAERRTLNAEDRGRLVELVQEQLCEAREGKLGRFAPDLELEQLFQIGNKAVRRILQDEFSEDDLAFRRRQIETQQTELSIQGAVLEYVQREIAECRSGLREWPSLGREVAKKHGISTITLRRILRDGLCEEDLEFRKDLLHARPISLGRDFSELTNFVLHELEEFGKSVFRLTPKKELGQKFGIGLRLVNRALEEGLDIFTQFIRVEFMEGQHGTTQDQLRRHEMLLGMAWKALRRAEQSPGDSLPSRVDEFAKSAGLTIHQADLALRRYLSRPACQFLMTGEVEHSGKFPTRYEEQLLADAEYSRRRNEVVADGSKSEIKISSTTKAEKLVSTVFPVEFHGRKIGFSASEGAKITDMKLFIARHLSSKFSSFDSLRIVTGSLADSHQLSSEELQESGVRVSVAKLGGHEIDAIPDPVQLVAFSGMEHFMGLAGQNQKFIQNFYSLGRLLADNGSMLFAVNSNGGGREGVSSFENFLEQWCHQQNDSLPSSGNPFVISGNVLYERGEDLYHLLIVERRDESSLRWEDA